MATPLRTTSPALEPADVVVDAMLAALRARDEDTCEHVKRVADLGLELTQAISRELASTPCLWHAFVLHDVGKIGLPDYAFDKPGPLESWERTELEKHPLVGGRMVDELPFLPRIVRDIVTCHHERWDGTGYPLGLRAGEIPLAARIFSVVDAFDAMTHDRVYHGACPEDAALDELERCSGSQFDPRAVEAFIRLMQRKRARTSSRALASAE